MANTKIVRLTTGEELIANLERDGEMVTLSKPLLLIPMQEGRLTFATWLPYNEDETVVLHERGIMFEINPVEQMSNQYQEATGQIVTPSSKIIT